MIDKIAASVAGAIGPVMDGATVLIGGFGTAGTYPGIACVKRIYSDLAPVECTPQGLRMVDAVAGLSRAELERLLGLPMLEA